MFTKRSLVLFQPLKVHLYRQYNKNIPFEDIPEVSASTIKKALKAHNINYEDGYACFITPCASSFHGPKREVRDKKMYINKTTGMFLCSFCKNTGQWHEFESFLNSKGAQGKKLCLEDNVTGVSPLKKIKDETTDVKSLTEEIFNGILKKFSLPLVKQSSLINLDVRVDATHTKLYFPLKNADNVVGYLSLDKSDRTEKILPESFCDGVLLGKLPKSKDTAVLVPTIGDFLVLLNSKISANVVYLPNCSTQLPQRLLPSLERFDKIIIWFGNDFNSWESARLFSKKLGEKRCFFVRPTDKCPLPHLLPEQDFKAVVNTAQPLTHKSITTFNALRQDVLSDLQNIDKVQGVKWKRFPTLNKVLKGHRRGELTIVTGPTGCGKTTFISEYSLDLAMQGINTLWGSFEIRNVRLARIMLQQMATVPLEENLEKFNVWADQFEKIPMYFMTFHGQQSIKVVMEAVEHATYVHDIAHVVIDNVQFMMGITEEHRHMDRFWKQDTIIAAFRTFATRKNCHVTLVIHPRKERTDEDLTMNSIFGGAKATQEADNVFIIQDKRLMSLKGKKYLHIAKNRYSGDLGVMPLDFDKKALSFVQKKRKVVDQKQTENE